MRWEDLKHSKVSLTTMLLTLKSINILEMFKAKQKSTCSIKVMLLSKKTFWIQSVKISHKVAGIYKETIVETLLLSDRSVG